MIIEKLDIITLEDDQDYVVVDILNHDDQEFYLLNLVDENENLLKGSKVMKKDKTKSDDIYLIEIKENATKIKLFELFGKNGEV